MAPCASPRLRARQHHVGLVAPGFAAAVASAGDARSAQSGTVSVVRTNKGDRCRWRLSGPQLPRRLPFQLCRGRRLDVNRRLAATRIRRVRTYLGAASHELMSLVFDEFFGELP